MRDYYRNFAELARAKRAGRDFSIEISETNSPVLIMAIHGGGIEAGTSELTRAISADSYNRYIFSGDQRSHNHLLHITSTRFDEPNALRLVARADYVISIHGATDEQPLVYLGGLDEPLLQSIQQRLIEAQFTTAPSPGRLSGNHPNNIVNKGKRRAGVQLELTSALRHSFFHGMSRASRQYTTERFRHFVQAIRTGIEDCLYPNNPSAPSS